jgi:acetolactate synthase regulatory subunit
MTRTFDVDLTGQDPAALVRILTTLRRRQCVVDRVDYRVADHHGPGWLTITLTPPRAHDHAVAAWLANLVDVGAVRTRDK